jgi:hypothetical protein
MSVDQHPVIQVLIMRQGCGLRGAKFLENLLSVIVADYSCG